jgi:5-formyltetrahydrofolate cyclo-ligase
VSKGVGGLSEDKDSMRERVLKERSELSLSDILEKSHGIYLNLISLDQFKKSHRIALYSSVRGEVRTDSIFFKALECGKEVYFPKVTGSSLSFYRVFGLEELAPGKFGVPEPDSGAPSVESRELDLLVLPGVAFDCAGSRLGYGKGFYDRFARDIPLGKRVGISYKFQLQKSIPTEGHDTDVGFLVHEQGIVFCGSKLGGY